MSNKNFLKKIFYFFHVLEYQKQGSALMMTLFILAGVLAVSLSSANLVISGIKMSRNQAQATKAYFITEAGSERVLWEARKNNFFYASCPEAEECSVDFSAVPTACYAQNCSEKRTEVLSANSSYDVKHASTTQGIIFTSEGQYRDTRRSVKVSFQFDEGEYEECIPNCDNRECGSDGCGGICGACGADLYCVLGTCLTRCLPQCTGRECGPDGCGRLCGVCEEAYHCFSGDCVKTYCQLGSIFACFME